VHLLGESIEIFFYSVASGEPVHTYISQYR
jgi:hypothetical protein